MIRIDYKTNKDYTSLNPPKFIQINSLLNTVLIPLQDMPYKVYPSDSVTFLYNNKTLKQKVGLDSGIVKFYDNEYYFFYIIPGFKINPLKNNYDIILGESRFKLNPTFDASYTPKIINGLIVLPNNFNFAFNNMKYGILSCFNKQIFSHIIKSENKYNYYMANTSNTLLHILNTINTNSLYELNNNHPDSYIRPLYNENFPLGSAVFNIDGVNNARIKVGNNIFNFDNIINVDYLPSGQYNIVLLDKDNNKLKIDYLNGTDWNKDSFDINIEAQSSIIDKKSSLLTFQSLDKPQKNFSNLTINIYPYHSSFEIFGPNKYYRKFNKGFQQLQDILPGNYMIRYNNIDYNILVIKNDNNYFSNINK